MWCTVRDGRGEGERRGKIVTWKNLETLENQCVNGVLGSGSDRRGELSNNFAPSNPGSCEPGAPLPSSDLWEGGDPSNDLWVRFDRSGESESKIFGPSPGV